MLSAPQPQFSPRHRSSSRFSSRNPTPSNQTQVQSDGPRFTLTSEDSSTSGEITLEGLNDLSSPSSSSSSSRSRSHPTIESSNSSLFVPVTDGRGRIIPKRALPASSNPSISNLNNPKRAETRSLPLNTRNFSNGKSSSSSSLRSMTLKTAQAHFVRLSNEHQVEIQGLGFSHLIREPQSVVIDSSDEEDSDSNDEDLIKSKGSPKLGSPKLGSPKLGSPKLNSSLRRVPSTLTNLSRDFNQVSSKFPDSPKRRHSRGGWSAHSNSSINTNSSCSMRRNFARTWSGETISFGRDNIEEEEENIKTSSELEGTFTPSTFSTFSESSEETSDLSTTESDEDSSIESLENLSLSDESDREEEKVFTRNERSLNKLTTNSSESLSSTSSFESDSTSKTSIHSQEGDETSSTQEKRLQLSEALLASQSEEEEVEKNVYQSDSENSLYKGFTNSIFSSSEDEGDSEEEVEYSNAVEVSKAFYGLNSSFTSSQYHQDSKYHHSRQLRSKRASGYYSSDSEDDWEFSNQDHQDEDDDDEEFETIILGIGNINDEISQPLSTNLIKPNPRPTTIAEMQSKINLPVIVAPKVVVDKLLAKI